AYWEKQARWPDFERGWRQALHDGFIADTHMPAKVVRVKDGFYQIAPTGRPSSGTGKSETAELRSSGLKEYESESDLVHAVSVPEKASEAMAPFAGPHKILVHVENLEVCFRP